jgi:hypothetical protein
MASPPPVPVLSWIALVVLNGHVLAFEVVEVFRNPFRKGVDDVLNNLVVGCPWVRLYVLPDRRSFFLIETGYEFLYPTSR